MHRGGWRQRAAGRWSAAAMAMLLAVPLVLGCGPAESPRATGLPVETRASGIRIRLTDVQARLIGTVLRLELRREMASRPSETFLPITSEMLDVTGFVGDERLWGSLVSYPERDGWLPVDLLVGYRPAEPGEATVTIEWLLVAPEPGLNGSPRRIEGPWTFVLPRSVFDRAAVAPTVFAVEREIATDHPDLRIVLHRLLSSQAGTGIVYRLETGKLGPSNVLENGLRVRLSNGGLMEASGEWPLPDGSRVAEFPPLGEQTRAFAVEWYPWVVAHPEPVRIELDLSPLWAVPEGAIVPLGTAFELGGEPLTVTSVQRRGDEMVLVVRNQLDPEARRRLLVGPVWEGIVLRADTGKVYRNIGGSTGLERDERGGVFAGASTLEFELPPVGTQRVWLEVPVTGRLVRAPAVTLALDE